MTETEKLKKAKDFIDKMVQGINPFTDEEADEEDMINNVRITRCLVYVSDILRQVIENGGTVSPRGSNHERKNYFFITDEQKKCLSPIDDYVFAKEITELINEITEENECRKFQAKWITDFFLQIGMMTVIDGKRRATETGLSIGIKSELRIGTAYGDYWANSYSPQAQQFIFDHIDAIIARDLIRNKEGNPSVQ